MAKTQKTPKLTHLDSKGAARMVEVGTKASTLRRALAMAEVRLSPVAFAALDPTKSPKGDVLGVARIAGIQAAKRTSELIPLCHPIAISGVKVDLQPDKKSRVVRITAEVKCTGQTGVEMEALTAASVAALALYDMLKAVDKGIVIGPIQLIEKSGGKSGDWKRSK